MSIWLIDSHANTIGNNAPAVITYFSRFHSGISASRPHPAGACSAVNRLARRRKNPLKSLLGRLTHGVCLSALLLCTAVHAQDAENPDMAAPVFAPIGTQYGEIRTAQDVAIIMRDDTLISVDIYLPDDDDAHPALYAAGPYPHTSGILSNPDTEVGPVAWYVSQGYAVVIASVRGTGLSQGEFGFFSREEQQDHYEIVEWIAQQPWSDGQVAGTGAGYYAAAQWQTAIQNPPHLECIAPINGILDPYRELVYPGGVANNAIIRTWYDSEVRLANAYAPQARRLVNYDMRLAQLSHPEYDDYWQIRGSLDNANQVSVPVFALNNWSLDPAEPGLTGTFTALSRLNVTNKILLSNPSDSVPLYQHTGFLDRELQPFYQWCFNGRRPSSSFVAQPRIRFLVRGQNNVKRESTWPPGNITQQSWPLDNNSGDSTAGMLQGGARTGRVSFTAYTTGGEDAVMRFVSAPLASNLEITGPVMLELYGSSTAADMAFEATLQEEMVFRRFTPDPLLPSFLAPGVDEESVDEEGSTRVTVTRGALKASARTRDDAVSAEFQPVYAGTGSEMLTPGNVVRMDVALRQTAYRFSAGNRIILEIKPVNDGSLPDSARQDMVYHSTRYPSRLWLPVVRSPQTTAPASQVPAVPGNPGNDDGQPNFDFLDPAALDALNGEVENPVIFVPR